MVYNPGQKLLGNLKKLQLGTHYFGVGSHNLICRLKYRQKNIWFYIDLGIPGFWLPVPKSRACVAGI